VVELLDGARGGEAHLVPSHGVERGEPRQRGRDALGGVADEVPVLSVAEDFLHTVDERGDDREA
jgi:hypothetical protein